MIRLFLIVFFAASVSHGSFFIGNGGEGLRQGSKIVLRDLYEANLAERPFFGAKIDAKVAGRLRGSAALNGLSVDMDLLARKLTDIQALYPFLGEALAEVIGFYGWILVDGALTPIDDGGLLIRDPEAELVQIANRLLGTIRIQREAWEKMSPEHRVALILHEAVYGALTVKCQPIRPITCRQSAPQAREAVAFFFTEAGGPLPFSVMTALGLRPAQALSTSRKLEVRIVNCTMGAYDFAGCAKSHVFTAAIENGDSPEARMRLYKQVCARYGRYDYYAKVGVIYLGRRDSYEMGRYFYQTGSDINDRQMAVRLLRLEDLETVSGWFSCDDDDELWVLNGFYDALKEGPEMSSTSK